MNSSQLLTAARAINSTIYQSPWSSHVTAMESSLQLQSNLRTVLPCVLSFVAAAISSAGGVGVGGGSLYVPILNVVAGLSINTSTAFSTFMVTGGTLSNVLYTLLVRGSRPDGQPLIDYDIAVVSQPCLLLGVSVGVACSVMFPEWLIFALFSAFLSFATLKTYGTGMRRWRGETEARRRVLEGVSAGEGIEELLIVREGHGCHWMDLVVLGTVWLFFFIMHMFIGGEGDQGVFDMKTCGVAYWLITVAQIPIAVAFTACIVQHKRKLPTQNSQVVELAIAVKSRLDAMPVYVFSVAALLTGAMSGLFGIGGGLLLNPVLLQTGVPPKTASATTMFMVLFSASMSMVQFIILGVDGIAGALVYAAACFVGSIVGLVVIEGVIRKSGRVSLIVLTVAAVLALSKGCIAYSGAVRVWAQYTSGQYMGFELPC